MRAWRKRIGDVERGAVTIEFIVTLPLFVAALAFVFEFGRIFTAHQGTVNNVRSALRYLSRSDMSAADITRATNIVRTGQISGGVTPDYLSPANATITFTDPYETFSNADFRVDGRTIRVVTRVEFPLTLFGIVNNDGFATIPFVVVEDERYQGV
jgi:Flp pilus assembly protein TadG